MENLLNNLEKNWQTLDKPSQDLISLGLVILGVLILRYGLMWLIVTQVRRLTQRTQTKWDDIILSHLEVPLRYFSLAIVLFFMLNIFEIHKGISDFLDNFAQMLVVVSVALLIYQILEESVTEPYWISRIWGRNIHPSLLPFLQTGIRMILISLAAVIIIEVWGYDVNGLVAGFGIGGLAVALAAQDTLANLFGFSTIVGDQPFVVGEYIKTPAVEGSVEQVGLRSTRIRQLDQAIVTVPNSTLANAPILNWSRLGKRRIDLTLGLPYTTTSAQMRELLKALRGLLRDWETVETDTVVVYFTHFGASSLDVLVRCYVLKSDWAEFTAEKELIQLALMELVEKQGLSLAFPSHSLYIESLPEVKTTPHPIPAPPTTDRDTRYVPNAPDGDVR